MRVQATSHREPPRPGNGARDLTIDPQRCILAATPRATCSRCSDICPHGAIIDDEDGLSIDADACTHCGLCEPVCPEGAISVSGDTVQRGVSALLACRFSAAQGQVATLSCIHSVSLERLATLYQGGVRQIELKTADCSTCPYGETDAFSHTLSLFNGIAESRGLETVRTTSQPQPLTVWQSVRPRLRDKADAGRRGFLRAILPAGDEVLPEPDEPHRAAALEALLARPAVDAPALHRAVPHIDAAKCTACDTCFRLCPHDALISRKDLPDDPRYEVRPDRCTGCGLCVAVCDTGAVTIEPAAKAETSCIALSQFICRACGVLSFTPQVAGTKQELCWTCRRSNHHSKLFQVLE